MKSFLVEYGPLRGSRAGRSAAAVRAEPECRRRALAGVDRGPGVEPKNKTGVTWKFWLLAILLAWFGRDGVRGQQRQPVTSLQPDCMVTFNLSVASSGAQATPFLPGQSSPPAGSAGTSLVIDNHQAGCYGWTVFVDPHNLAALSLAFQSAPDNAAGTAPGTWSTVAVCGGTECLGINPNTGITPAITTTKKADSWFRVNLTSKTGAGAAVGVLYGYKVNVVANGGGAVIPSTCPGGLDTQVQYNAAGACGGMAGTSWDNVAGVLDFLNGITRLLEISTDPDGNNGDGLILSTNPSNISLPVTTGASGSPGAEILVTAVAGGNTSIVTTGSGGKGGSVALQGRGGGTAPSAATASTGGDGGSINIITGFGGQATNAANVGTNLGGNGGSIALLSRDGGDGFNGASNTGGSGGSIALSLGSGGTGSTANGLDGTLIVTAGARANAPIAQLKLNGGAVVGTFNETGSYTNLSVVIASIGTPANGTQIYCSDCTVTSGSDNTCAGSGTGAKANRVNGAWKCYQ